MGLKLTSHPAAYFVIIVALSIVAIWLMPDRPELRAVRHETDTTLVEASGDSAVPEELEAEASGSSDETPTATVREGTTEDAHQIHAEAYAADIGVDVDEAKRRLELQALAMDLTGQLMTHERDVMGGVRIEHLPDLHIVISVIPGGEGRVRPYLAGSPLAEITTFETVALTEDDLVADLERANELLRPLEIRYAAVVYDTESLIFVEDAGEVERIIEAAGVELPATVRIVEVELLDEDDVDEPEG